MGKLSRIMRGLFGIFATVLVIAIGAEQMLDVYRSSIDLQLGTTSYQVVTADTEADLYNFKSDYASAEELVAAHHALADTVMEEGIVLLRNDNGALPLAQDEKVTLLGMRMNYPQYGGQISMQVTKEQIIDPFTAFADSGFDINPVMKKVYEELTQYTELGRSAKATDFQPGKLTNSFGVSNDTTSLEIYECDPDAYGELSSTYTDEDIIDSCGEYGTAIVMLGRPTSEAADFIPGAEGIANPDEFEADKDILGLSINEQKLLQYAVEHFDKVVVLINSGNAMDLPELKEYDIDAAMYIGEPSCFGFRGVANVLNGSANPSGHLADTFATRASRSPAVQNYGVFTFANQDPDIKDKRNGWYVAELEGIYVGYYYYETRYFDSVANPDSNASVATPASSTTGDVWNYDDEMVYPFGYGLSYTTFDEEITALDADFENLTLTAKVKVTNTGDVVGKHVVQLYASLPYIPGGLEKSAIQLAGYEKTGLIEPNASEEVEIAIDLHYITSYDETIEHDGTRGAYLLDAGDYYFATGNGAHEAVNNVLKAMGYDVDGNADLARSVSLDAQKLITESLSGTMIENQLQDADLKNNGVEVTYLSRSDWNGTFPQPLTDLAITDEMTGFENTIYTVKTGETSDVKWGQNYGIMFSDLKPAAGEKLDYDDPKLLQFIEQMDLEDVMMNLRVALTGWHAVESLGLPAMNMAGDSMGYNDRPIGDAAAATGPYTIDADDPNYNFNTSIIPVLVSSTFSHDVAAQVGALMGNDSIWNGGTLICAPGANQHRTPYCGRNHEYFSEDPMLTAYMANDWIAAGNDYGIMNGPKHFAFNDEETNRAGIATFITEQRARECELRGFQLCVESGNADTLMTTFARVGSVYGSAHTGLIQGILRDEWDYKGIVFSDMVNGPTYMNVESSIIAGTDLMTSGSDTNLEFDGWTNFTPEGIAGDARMMERVQEATHHVMWTLANSNFMNGFDETSHTARLYPWYERIALGIIAGAGILTLISLIAYIVSLVKSKKKEA